MKRTIIALATCFLILSASADVSQPTHGSDSFDLAEIIATADRTNPFDSFQSKQRTDADLSRCCKVCTKGKPCGDTCIAQDKTCHVGPGCAC